MKATKTGLILASAAAALFIAGCATNTADNGNNEAAQSGMHDGTTAKDRNSCKGKSSCSGKSN